MSSPLPIPRSIPVLLSFAAGYVDSCTFLALFGLFVAQVTGSFVMIGTDFMAHEPGSLIKMLGIPVFFCAGVLTAILAQVLQRRGRSPLMWTLTLECALLAGFLALGLIAPLPPGPDAPLAVLMSMLGLSAMGVQSALVRLLMPAMPSTNVMTTNTTMLAIDSGELLLAWQGRRKGDDASATQFIAARRRLAGLVPIPLGFLAGTITGAIATEIFGLRCLAAIIALLLGLIAWAAKRG
jgi:uncharacterized membrane protein YoaK (UPF0700 family)